MATQNQSNTANVIDTTLLAQAQMSLANEPYDPILDIAVDMTPLNAQGGHTVTLPILDDLAIDSTSDGAAAAAEAFSITQRSITINKFLSGNYAQTWRSAMFQNQTLSVSAVAEFIKEIRQRLAASLHGLYTEAGLGTDASSTQFMDDADVRGIRLDMRKTAKWNGEIFSFVHADNEDALLAIAKYENWDSMGTQDATRNGVITRARGVTFFRTHLAPTSTGSSQQLYGAMTRNPVDAPVAYMTGEFQDEPPGVLLRLPQYGARIREYWNQAGTRSLMVDMAYGVKSMRPAYLGVFESKPAA